MDDLTLQTRLGAKKRNDRVFLFDRAIRADEPFDRPAVQVSEMSQLKRGDLPLAGFHEADGGPLETERGTSGLLGNLPAFACPAQALPNLFKGNEHEAPPSQ